MSCRSTRATRLTAEAPAKSDGRNETVALNLRRRAGEVHVLATQIEVREFAGDGDVRRQPELGAPANSPAGIGVGIGPRRASSQDQFRAGGAHQRVAIVRDRYAGLGVYQEP